MKKFILSLLFVCSFAASFATISARWLSEWNSLTEDEQWLCLFSEPLMEMNNLNITSVNPEPYIPAGKKSWSQAILEESWGCYSRDGILTLVDDFRLKSKGHNVTFSMLKQKLDQIPLSPNQKPSAAVEQLAIKECLDFCSIARLYFIAENNLGDYGLLAWDYGRLLTVLRWGVGAGWLTEEEAVKLGKPFIDVLVDAYDSWEDYAVHYAFGRAFFAISNGKDYDAYFSTVLKNVKQYDIEVAEDEKDKVFTFHDIKFPGRSVNGSPVLTYKDAVFKPSKEAIAWINAAKYEVVSGDLTSEGRMALESFLKKKKNIPVVAYNNALLLIEKETAKANAQIGAFKQPLSDANKQKIAAISSDFLKKQLKFYADANPAFVKSDKNNELYFKFSIEYLSKAMLLEDLKTIEAVFGDNFQELEDVWYDTVDYQYLACMYMALRSAVALQNTDIDEAYDYANTARKCLDHAAELPYYGYVSVDDADDIADALDYVIELCELYYVKIQHREP